MSAPILAATPVVEGKPPAPGPAPAAAAPATPVAPPAGPAKLSAAELEKLLMPIALYPDPLLATILPASVYPLEIVQAARFVADTNNLAKLDEQAWDESVKAVARIPDAIKKLNEDLEWTIRLGEAFLSQDKDVMDTIQSLRLKAQTAGTLRTSEQQTIVVTNMVVEKTVEEKVVVVTNTVVQIQPSNPQTVYVPSYPPTVYYPPPGYVYDPYAPLVTFAAGVTMGAIIANNCDWHHGGCYWGGGGDVNIDRDTNINIDRGDRTNIRGGDRVNAQGGNRAGGAGTPGGKKWQPDQSRLRSSGSPKTMEARGYGSGTAGNRAGGAQPRASTQAAGGFGGQSAGSARPGGGGVSGGAGGVNRPSTPSVGTRPSTPSAANRPASSPSVGSRPSAGASSAGSSVSSANRSSGGSAFSGGAAQRSYSDRGSASRGGGGFSGGGGFGGGGGGRGGGGRGGGGRR